MGNIERWPEVIGRTAPSLCLYSQFFDFKKAIIVVLNDDMVQFLTTLVAFEI